MSFHHWYEDNKNKGWIKCLRCCKKLGPESGLALAATTCYPADVNPTHPEFNPNPTPGGKVTIGWPENAHPNTHPMNAERLAGETWKEKLKETTNGLPPAPGMESAGAPQPINPETGQHEAYYVLPADERAKGYVRPLRRSYVHVGPEVLGELRELSDDEKTQYSQLGYVRYEKYPASAHPRTGRFWTQDELDRLEVCGAVTKMSRDIAETYARDPKYYGQTFCVKCKKHYAVTEFVWDGTQPSVIEKRSDYFKGERVGS